MVTQTQTTELDFNASLGIHMGDRKYQQDQVAFIVHPNDSNCALAVIADGMGGLSGGRKASDQVILTAKQLFKNFNPTTNKPRTFLKQLIMQAHTLIRLIAISTEEQPHSTIAIFLILPDGSCHWAHVGDSRVFLFNKSDLLYRTKDHSYVQSLVDDKKITEEQAINHPKSNILNRCLGSYKTPQPDYHSIKRLQPDQYLLACSDGLWPYFRPKELGIILSNYSPREAIEALINIAHQRSQGHGDNISAVIVKISKKEIAQSEMETEKPLGHNALISSMWKIDPPTLRSN